MKTSHTFILIPAFLLGLGAIGLAVGCDGAADVETARQLRPTQAVHEHDGHENEAHDHHSHDEEAHGDEVTLTPEAIEHYGVKVGVARRIVPSVTLTAPARIAFNAERVAHIGSLVQGRVVELAAKLGDRVEAGGLLFVLDSPELGRLQSDYLSRRTMAESTKPMVGFAQAAHERAVRLHEGGGGMSLAEVQRRERKLAEARRDWRMAEAELTAAENALRLGGMSDERIRRLAELGCIDPRATINAPMAGQVIEREATLGELVSPDDERLMVLADLSQVWALVDVAESKLAQVRVGTPVTLEVFAVSGRSFEGKVTHIAPQIDQSTRTAQLRVELENTDRLLRPGMFAQATITVGSGSEQVLAVPAASVMEMEGEPSVFVPVPGEENTFARRAVRVGRRVGHFMPILSGLEEGDQVVTDGVFILKQDLGKAGAEHAH